MTLKLWLTQRSPYARMVRVALHEKGVTFTEENLDLAHLPAEFLAKNAAGTVPTLELDGLVLTDSQQILHYLEEKFPSPPLVGNTVDAAYEAWHWVALANRLCEQNVAVFFEQQKAEPRQELLTKSASVTNRIVTALDKRLTETRAWLGTDFGVADIALGTVMKWMAFRLNHSWTHLQTPTQVWLGALDSRPSFQKTLPRLG